MSKENYIRNIELFKNVDPLLVCGISNLKSFIAGDVLYYESDVSNYLYFLVSGNCSALKSSNNSVISLYTLQSGLINDFKFDSLLCSHTAVFESDSIVLCVDYEKFKAIIMPLIFQELLNEVINRNDLLNSSIDSSLVFDSLQRVAFMLLNKLSLFNSLKRVKVAAMLNLTPETLSRVLHKLSKEDVIQLTHNSVVVVDEARLSDVFV